MKLPGLSLLELACCLLCLSITLLIMQKSAQNMAGLMSDTQTLAIISSAMDASSNKVDLYQRLQSQIPHSVIDNGVLRWPSQIKKRWNDLVL